MKMLTLLLLLLCFSACTQNTRSNKLSQYEIDACAWLIEDICHGLNRSPRELVTAESSIGQLNIATWIGRGDLSTVQDSYPLYIQKRRDIWLLLRQGIQTGAIISQADGYLRLVDSSDHVQRQIFAEAINNENQLRLNIDRLALQHAGLEARSQRAQALLRALNKARRQLDHHHD